MAFALSEYNNGAFSTDVFGLLGLKSDNPFFGITEAQDSLVFISDVDTIVATYVEDYDTLTSSEQDRVYYNGLKIFAGLIYMNYLPNAIPKYISDNKAVVDRFRNVNFVQMGKDLYSAGIAGLKEVVGTAYTGSTVFIVASPTTDIITDEDN